MGLTRFILPGIWPEAPAFTDSGLGPVPKYFRGSCTKGDRFRSARDDFGHGTNTASVAVGAGVLIQNQLAIGGAPNARLSVYKVCWFNYLCHQIQFLYD